MSLSTWAFVSFVLEKGGGWEREERERKGVTYDDLDVGVDSPQRLQHGVVRRDYLLHRPPECDIIRSQHEVRNVRLRVRRPAADILLRNVHRLPPRVPLVARVEVARRGAAALGVVGHGTDEVDLGGEGLGG